jgi:hypothetical protein
MKHSAQLSKGGYASLNPNKLRRRFFTPFRMIRGGAEWRGIIRITRGISTISLNRYSLLCV